MSADTNTVNWYVVYTRPKSEFRVRDRLIRENIECYLPLIKTLRLWSDRKKWVTIPLFSSYIFVRIPLHDYSRIMRIDGVVKFIRFSDGPVPVPEKQIKVIRMYEKSGDIITEEEVVFKTGDKVEVIHGPLKGLIGRMIAIGRRKKVQIMIEGVQQSVYVYIPKSFLRKIPG